MTSIVEQTYFTEIKKFPLLSPQEEYELAVNYYERKCLDSARKLIVSNLRFVVRIAHGYKHLVNDHVKIMDFIQEGNIGLMMAVKKYNPYKNVKFISYAVYWIKSYIQEYIFNNWNIIKLFTTQKQRELYHRLENSRRKLIATVGNDDIDNHLSDEFGISINELKEYECRLSGNEYTSYYNDGEKDIIADIVDDKYNQEQQYLQIEQKQTLQDRVKQAIAKLPEREQYIINSFYLEGKENFAAIAEKLNISRQRVEQIKGNIFRKLREELIDVKEDGYCFD